MKPGDPPDIHSTYMKGPRSLGIAVLAIFMLAGGGPARSAEPAAGAPKKAAPASTAPATVATVGSRKVDALDIQRAASALGSDPLRAKNPAAWKRMLLDRCVDRELLAAEAERRGLDKEPAIQKKAAEREYLILLRETYSKVLVPSLAPTPEQIAELQRSGLYRDVDLYYILVLDDRSDANRALALRVLARAQAGARWDSLAKIYSGHPPSRAAGGRLGWVLARDLNPLSYDDMRKAKEGDVLGIYACPYGHEMYKIGAFRELSGDSIYKAVFLERKREIANDLERSLLTKYHFALDSTQVNAVLFTVGSESPDSILASLGPDGTRPRRGVRPAIGILATCDGDSVTFPEVLQATPPSLGSTGRMRIPNAEELHRLCARVVIPELTVRNAVERGLTRDPEVARELRLAREEILTSALVEQDIPPRPDDAAVRSMIDAHPDRYRRPRGVVAKVAMFADPESAAQALRDWATRGMADTLLAARRMRPQPRATAATLLPGWYATLSFAEGTPDSLCRAVQGLAAGAFAPVVTTGRGWAVAQIVSKQEEGPLPFEEARYVALREWRRSAESKWVEQETARLRATTPVKVIPGRLESVKVAPPAKSSAAGEKVAR
jgi:peptidyl-prolyl cis-trans isomerase C